MASVINASPWDRQAYAWKPDWRAFFTEEHSTWWCICQCFYI